MNLYNIIKGAIITEKTAVERANNGVYTFKVDCSATKEEVKKAIQSIFGVKVAEVRTVNVDGKRKRLGKYIGKTSAYKKAYVKLVEGNVIPQFEGV